MISLNKARKGLSKVEEDYPTDKQMDMYFYWQEVYYDDLKTEAELKDEGEVTQVDADEFGVSFAEADEAITKVLSR